VNEAAAHIELAALPTSPFWARRHAQAVLGAWQICPDITEVALLLVSELVTNAVAATTAQPEPEPAAARPIVQTLRHQPGRIVIEVSDSAPGPPVITDAGPDAETGRGLAIVQALSKEWSYHYPPAGGKTVHCTLSTPTTHPAPAMMRDSDTTWKRNSDVSNAGHH